MEGFVNCVWRFIKEDVKRCQIMICILSLVMKYRRKKEMRYVGGSLEKKC